MTELNDPDILDAGIRQHVLALRSAGIDTFASCEGGPGHAHLDPIVQFQGDDDAGSRAALAASECGLPIIHVRRTWNVFWDGILSDGWWEITFAATSS